MCITVKCILDRTCCRRCTALAVCLIAGVSGDVIRSRTTSRLARWWTNYTLNQSRPTDGNLRPHSAQQSIQSGLQCVNEPFRCRESRPYHEEPRLKTSFYLSLSALAALFLHCSAMVMLTSLPALSLQRTEVELYSGRRRIRWKKEAVIYIITFAKEFMFSPVYVSLSVCLLTWLLKNYWLNLHEILTNGCT